MKYAVLETNYVAFYGFTYMLAKYRVHDALICHTSILQVKGYHCVAVYAHKHPKGCVLFIFRVYLYLIIP